MGTNYYFIPKRDDDADVKKAHELVDRRQWEELAELVDAMSTKIHIGKSSYGWQFLFNYNNGKYYEATKASIDKFLRSDGKLVDEYGEEKDVDDFWKMVDKKKDGLDSEKYNGSHHDWHSSDGECLRFSKSDWFC